MTRALRLFEENLEREREHRDRSFLWLHLAQWAFAIVVALVYSPYRWAGTSHAPHVHVYYAVFVGAAIVAPIAFLVRAMPGAPVTRHGIAVAQMLWSALLVHLTGGRIETHFHVFGSLAFLAFYRDWRVLFTATIVVAADHVLRGLYAPVSVYGIDNPEWWRFLEHAFWVVFENVVLVIGIQHNLREARVLAERQAQLEALNGTAVAWEWSASQQRFTYVSEQAADLLGCPAEKWLEPGFVASRIHDADKVTIGTTNVELRLRHDDGRWVWLRTLVSQGESRGILFDVSERRAKELDRQQTQKLEAVGRLASGIAHEINSPIQFVNDNLHFLRSAMDDLVDPSTKQEEMDYLQREVPLALNSSLEGIARVARIVQSMREFAHPDQNRRAPADINAALATTLTIAQSEIKNVADVERDFGVLPPLDCNIGELNQVFLNLLVNAAQAIGSTGKRGTIAVRTRCEDGAIAIAIRDTGNGIPEAIRTKVFDPFFTTKEVGRGTGQGLAIARAIVSKHDGTLGFTSEDGSGTTFVIRLPLAIAKAAA